MGDTIFSAPFEGFILLDKRGVLSDLQPICTCGHHYLAWTAVTLMFFRLLRTMKANGPGICIFVRFMKFPW